MDTTNTAEKNNLHTPPQNPLQPPVVRDDYPIDEWPTDRSTVPGQQIGLYCDADERDVRQMVRMMNNPGEESQDSRG